MKKWDLGWEMCKKSNTSFHNSSRVFFKFNCLFCFLQIFFESLFNVWNKFIWKPIIAIQTLSCADEKRITKFKSSFYLIFTLTKTTCLPNFFHAKICVAKSDKCWKRQNQILKQNDLPSMRLNDDIPLYYVSLYKTFNI